MQPVTVMADSGFPNAHILAPNRSKSGIAPAAPHLWRALLTAHENVEFEELRKIERHGDFLVCRAQTPPRIGVGFQTKQRLCRLWSKKPANQPRRAPNSGARQ
jgi:hypothetical protein